MLFAVEVAIVDIPTQPPNPSPPGTALRALVRLLAQQAAREAAARGGVATSENRDSLTAAPTA